MTTPNTAPDTQWAALSAEERREFLFWAWSLGMLDADTSEDVAAAELLDVLDLLDEHLDEYPDMSAVLNLFFARVPPDAIPVEVINAGARAATLVLYGLAYPLTLPTVTRLLHRAGLMPAEKVIPAHRVSINRHQLVLYLHRARWREMDPLGEQPGPVQQPDGLGEEFELPRQWNPRELWMDDIWGLSQLVDEASACGALIVPPGLTATLAINPYDATSSVDVEYGWKLAADGVDFALFDDGHQLKYIGDPRGRDHGPANAWAMVVEAQDQINAMLAAYEKHTGREFRPRTGAWR